MLADDDEQVRRIEAIETLGNETLSVVPGPIRAHRDTDAARWIQGQMARFSDGVEHRQRRFAVEQLLATLPVVPLLNHTRDETEARLAELADGWADAAEPEAGDQAYGQWLDSGTMTLDAMPFFARRRPVMSLLQFLLPDIDDVEPLVDDVRALVHGVVPGAVATPASNASAERMLEHLGDGPDGIAAISVVFQTHDATAALIGQALVVDEPGCTARDRVNWAVLHGAPVTRTLRYATDAVDPGATPAPTVVPLDSVGPLPLTFGSGAHACPGRHLAALLAEAVIGPLVDRRWRPLPNGIVYEDRPNLSLPARLPGRLDLEGPPS
ncbi:MAG: hypothetical protein R2733_02395 [Acidimicrobiales bacterium]